MREESYNGHLCHHWKSLTLHMTSWWPPSYIKQDAQQEAEKLDMKIETGKKKKIHVVLSENRPRHDSKRWANRKCWELVIINWIWMVTSQPRLTLE